MGSVKPDSVIISVSSTPSSYIFDSFKDTDYDFTVKLIVSPDKQVAGENRNIAKQHLKTDIISFMDIDDVATLQRVEFIKRAFEENPDIDVIVHNYIPCAYFYGDESEIIEDDYRLLKDGVYRIPNNMCLHIHKAQLCNDSPYKDISYPGAIMHSQISVRRDIVEKYTFDNYDRGEIEDVVMIKKLWDAGVKFAYLDNLLSKYRPKSV